MEQKIRGACSTGFFIDGNQALYGVVLIAYCGIHHLNMSESDNQLVIADCFRMDLRREGLSG
jgi:hypothetical protein